MTRHHAQAFSPVQRAMQRALHRLGWTVQGQLGGHFRPLVLVTPVFQSWPERLAWHVFWWSLPDRGRIVRLAAGEGPKALAEQLTEAGAGIPWLSCVGFDARRRVISVHRPFHPGPVAERSAGHVCRYLSYFEGRTTTPPPSEAALAAEREGY